jgi:hypothetical protein
MAANPSTAPEPAAGRDVENARTDIVDLVRTALTKGAPVGGFLTNLTRAIERLEAAEARAGVTPPEPTPAPGAWTSPDQPLRDLARPARPKGQGRGQRGAGRNRRPQRA